MSGSPTSRYSSFVPMVSGAQRSQRLAGQPVPDPLVHRHRPERLIEMNGGLVPIQHRPVDAPVSGLMGDDGKLADQVPADPTGPIAGSHVEILEGDPCTSRPGGEGEEPDGRGG